MPQSTLAAETASSSVICESPLQKSAPTRTGQCVCRDLARKDGGLAGLQYPKQSALKNKLMCRITNTSRACWWLSLCSERLALILRSSACDLASFNTIAAETLRTVSTAMTVRSLQRKLGAHPIQPNAMA